jgi:hypothetical protein
VSGEGLATGAAVVCPAVARCVGEGAATVLVVEEEGAVWRLAWSMMLGALGFQSHTTGIQLYLTHPQNPQTHPQSSRYTPRCPSVVLWTPCSGVEWRVFEPAVNGGKAARRASSLRTWAWRVQRSPCPSSPTTRPPYVPRPSAVDLDRDMLNPTPDLLSHCHRRG